MKRRRLWLVALSLICLICLCFCFVACNDGNNGNNGGKGDNGGDNRPVIAALAAPMVAIDKDGKAEWNEIANASGYAFKINGGAEQTTEIREVRLTNGQSVAVKAKGDGVSYADSDWSNVKTYTAPTTLPAPQNLTVAIQGSEAGRVNLSWHAVEGADGYRYVVNDVEQTAVNVEDNSVTVNLCAIDAARLDATWTFKVKALGNDSREVADDGDYSDRRESSDYCAGVEFAASNDDTYTATEILKIINYYGENLPDRYFMVSDTVKSNCNGNAVFDNGFTIFGKDIPDLYLAIDGKLSGLNVIAMGTLAVQKGVKGLSNCSVDFEGIAENDGYALVKDTLEAWDKLKATSKIMGDFCLPVKLYGVNIMWAVEKGEDAFEVDDDGNVTVVNPPSGAENIAVTLSAILYVDDGHSYDDVLEFTFAVAPDSRTQLAAPKINIDPKTGVATWNEIEHATGYLVIYQGYSPEDTSGYVYEQIVIAADDDLSVTLKDKWQISVQALGDSTAYSDSDVVTKQYNYYPETVEPDGTPLEFDMTVLTQTGELSNADYIFGKACGKSSVFVSASAERVVLGNDDSNGAVMGTGFIKVGSSSNNGKITLNFNKKITGVVITARQWNKDQNDKVSVNDSAEQTASKNDWGIMNFNFTASNASKTVEINTNNRVFIKSIVVYVQD